MMLQTGLFVQRSLKSETIWLSISHWVSTLQESTGNINAPRFSVNVDCGLSLYDALPRLSGNQL